jgi:hypothetical protein
MRWVRANLRFGAWCALLALVLQFAISFGHVHAPGAKKGLLLAQLVVPSSAGLPEAPAKPAKPAKHIAYDQCAICASIQLASGLLPGAAPSFALPAQVGAAWLTDNIDVALAASPQNSFQARAPPQA